MNFELFHSIFVEDLALGVEELKEYLGDICFNFKIFSSSKNFAETEIGANQSKSDAKEFPNFDQQFSCE